MSTDKKTRRYLRQALSRLGQVASDLRLADAVEDARFPRAIDEALEKVSEITALLRDQLDEEADAAQIAD